MEAISIVGWRPLLFTQRSMRCDSPLSVAACRTPPMRPTTPVSLGPLNLRLASLVGQDSPSQSHMCIKIGRPRHGSCKDGTSVKHVTNDLRLPTNDRFVCFSSREGPTCLPSSFGLLDEQSGNSALEHPTSRICLFMV